MHHRRGEDYYLRLADEEQLSKWRNIILDPASAPVYVDTEIEEEAKQAMLRSIAIIRGETEKIDLSLNKYTADLMVPSLAAVAGAPVFSTPSSTKYDAFKHRTFIYDEEEAEQIDASAAMTPETHLVGRARRDTADSLSMDFAQSVDLADGEEGNDSEVDNPAEEGEEREAGRGDDDEDEAVTTYDESAEAGAGSVVVDNAERVGATVTSDANDDAVPAMVDSTDSPGKVAMYKLAGGQQSRARTHKEPREHRPLPHTSSGNALEKPAQGTGEISAYKFGSQYQKGGDSWIKKESSSAGSTIKGSKGPKQIIPVADNKQPLARRHSSMINQCKLSCKLTKYAL